MKNTLIIMALAFIAASAWGDQYDFDQYTQITPDNAKDHAIVFIYSWRSATLTMPY